MGAATFLESPTNIVHPFEVFVGYLDDLGVGMLFDGGIFSLKFSYICLHLAFKIYHMMTLGSTCKIKF